MSLVIFNIIIIVALMCICIICACVIGIIGSKLDSLKNKVESWKIVLNVGLNDTGIKKVISEMNDALNKE